MEACPQVSCVAFLETDFKHACIFLWTCKHVHCVYVCESKCTCKLCACVCMSVKVCAHMHKLGTLPHLSGVVSFFKPTLDRLCSPPPLCSPWPAPCSLLLAWDTQTTFSLEISHSYHFSPYPMIFHTSIPSHDNKYFLPFLQTFSTYALQMWIFVPSPVSWEIGLFHMATDII